MKLAWLLGVPFRALFAKSITLYNSLSSRVMRSRFQDRTKQHTHTLCRSIHMAPEEVSQQTRTQCILFYHLFDHICTTTHMKRYKHRGSSMIHNQCAGELAACLHTICPPRQRNVFEQALILVSFYILRYPCIYLAHRDDSAIRLHSSPCPVYPNHRLP